MAIIDLPTTQAFKGAQFSLALDVSQSTFTGFLTGNRTRTSNLADRLRGSLLLPPVLDPVAAAARESLLMGMRSSGDWLRFSMPHRKMPNGSMRGNTVLAASAAAGARSISISGAISAPNLLQNPGFEIDSNADGMADQYSIYYSAFPAGLAYSLASGYGSPFSQRYAGDVTNGNSIGVVRTQAGVIPGAVYVYSVDLASSSTGLTPQLYLEWLNSGLAVVDNAVVSHTPSTAWFRRTLTATAPAGAAYVRLYVIHANYSGSTIAAATGYVDNMQLQLGAETAYAGQPTLMGGDWLGIGWNLVQVGYTGATGTDAGVLSSVSLSMPLPKAVSSGAAVTWSAPAGLWELDDEGLQLDYSAGGLQSGVAIPLRQVIA